jgi:PII-like signaling protein
VPAVTVIVDTPEHVRHSFRIVSELTPERGLVTSETVPVILK